jgi:peptidoglycan/xylan/chitin deacetylase (PgdA/CDA1 family)
VLVLFAAAIIVSCRVAPPEGVTILQYHMVNYTDKSSYNVPPEELRAQLEYLKKEGYTTISLLEFAKARKGKLELPPKPIIITFDDGYRDNYENALPIIEEMGMKATLFMVVNDIGRPKYCTMDDLNDWCRRGMELGSHTANHLEMPKLDSLKKEEEIAASKLLMEWRGLPTVFFLAYPYGEFDKETQKLLEKNDYLGGVTGNTGLNTFKTNMYELHRTNIPNPYFGLWEFKWRLLKAEIWARLGAN